jgi:hypothetical protein
VVRYSAIVSVSRRTLLGEAILSGIAGTINQT